MSELDDHQLLAEFARDNSEAAFAALVQRHVNLVYSVALRSVSNAHAAEEITQAVFIILAQKAGKISSKVILSGWLYQTARLAAANFLRGEIRRQQREQEAYMQSTLNESEASAWPQIAPLLDDALGKLGEADRNALVLRFFENKNLREVGTALGASEDAAKMRVNRALEKLRKIFGKRGVTFSAAAIAGSVSANSVHAAPVGLAKAISIVAAAKGAAAGGSTLALVKGTLKLMVWMKAKAAILVGVGVLLAVGTTTVSMRENNSVAVKDPSWTSDPWQSLNKVWLAMDDFGKQSAKTQSTDQSFAEMQKENAKIITIYREFFDHVPVGAQIRETPSNGKGNGVLSYSEGQFAGTSASFSNLLATAFGNNGQKFSTARMILSTNLPEGNFDYIVNVADHGPENLLTEIESQFGVAGRTEMRETNVLLLKVKNPDMLKLSSPSHLLSQSQKTAARYDLTKYWVRAANARSLPGILERDYFHLPVLDETGLAKNKNGLGLFVALPKNSNDLDLVRQALLDQLGLELVPRRERIEMLIVEKVK